MKLKYYLRGLGTGILFSTIVLCIAYSYRESTDDNDSNNETTTTTANLVEDEKKNDETTPIESSSSNNEEKSSTTNESTIDESTIDESTAEEQTTEEQTTEEQTTEEQTTEEKETQSVGNEKKVQIVIERGYSSYRVAEVLEEKGVIDNAQDFDRFLGQNDLDTRISTGVFEITIGASYDEIADIITY